MTSYLVTIVTDAHLICLKMRARNKRTATETSGADVLSSKKNLKNLRGGEAPPLYV